MLQLLIFLVGTGALVSVFLVLNHMATKDLTEDVSEDLKDE